VVEGPRGFTLVEILVALVVLEVGLLAVVGTSVLAARIMTRAELLERGVAEVERTYDSLAVVWPAGSGERSTGRGWVRWTVDGGGAVHIRFGLHTDSALVSVEGRLPAPGP